MSSSLEAHVPPATPSGQGTDLLLVFLGAIAAIVGAVVALAVVDTWWILVPVMVLDVAVTGAVMAALWRLFADPEPSD